MKSASSLDRSPLSFGMTLWAYCLRLAPAALRPAAGKAKTRAQHASQADIGLHLCMSDSFSGTRYAKEWLKLGARSRLNLRATQQWLPFWNSTPILAEIARSTPNVLQKIYRPYLSNRFGCDERLAIVTRHYAFMLQQGLGPLLLRAARYPVPLCALESKSGRIYQIQLAAVGTLDREGELVLHLAADGEQVYSIAFTFFAQGNAMAIGVGCLQGPRCDDGLERIRKATRDLHGLRPKALLTRLVQHIGHHFGCSELMLVGNRNLVGQRHIQKGKVHADYDTNWEEMGAQRRADGDYTLPCTPPATPDFTAIASKKRSEAKKRHALLASAAELACAGLRRPLFAVLPVAAAEESAEREATVEL